MADDLAADVWLAVARGLGRFQGDEGGFRSWIFTIARHRVVEHRRRQQRRRTDPVPDERLDHPVERGLGGDPAWLVVERVGAQQAIEAVVRELPPDQAEHRVAADDTAESAWQSLSTQRAVRLIASLPPDQAEAVLLRVLGGFDVAEVARIMGRTPGNVRVLCHRALRRLAARRSAEAEVVAE